MQQELSIWVVYIKGLAPYPDKYIARKHIITAGESRPTLETETGTTLEDVRAVMSRKGLICIARDKDDDPVIIETWI